MKRIVLWRVITPILPGDEPARAPEDGHYLLCPMIL
jgi:hypothetical protein